MRPRQKRWDREPLGWGVGVEAPIETSTTSLDPPRNIPQPPANVRGRLRQGVTGSE